MVVLAQHNRTDFEWGNKGAEVKGRGLKGSARSDWGSYKAWGHIKPGGWFYMTPEERKTLTEVVFGKAVKDQIGTKQSKSCFGGPFFNGIKARNAMFKSGMSERGRSGKALTFNVSG